MTSRLTRRRRPTLRAALGRGHLAIALLAVGLAGISGTLLGVAALRVHANHNLELIARSISYTVEAAVVFDDSPAASEALAVIAGSEEVADAKVFALDGDLLAHWQRDDTGLLAPLERQVAKALLDEPIYRPIVHQQRTVGHIELTGQGGSLLRFLLSGLFGILCCILLSTLVALHLSRRLFGDIVRGQRRPRRPPRAQFRPTRPRGTHRRAQRTGYRLQCPARRTGSLAKPPAKRKRDPGSPGQPR